MFYIYSPSERFISNLKELLERFSAFLLGFEISSSPYTTVYTSWLSVEVWVYSMFFNFLIIITSFIFWAKITKKLMKKQGTEPTSRLLWLLFTSFAIQYAVTLFVDVLNPRFQNLQLRIFPGFMFFAIPMTATYFKEKLNAYPKKGVRKTIKTLGIKAFYLALIALSAGSSMVRFSDDPAWSNNWHFHAEAEERGVKWIVLYVDDGDIFSDFDFRIGEAYDFYSGHQQAKKVDFYRYYSTIWRHKYQVHGYAKSVHLIFISELIKIRSIRLKKPIPFSGMSDRIYSNGNVQILKIPFESVKHMLP